jgi:hypothetical protein
MRSWADDGMAGRRAGGAGVRAAGAGAVRRSPAQDDSHPASRRVAADLRDRGGLRGWRAGVRLDGGRAQGRRDPRFALHSATVDPVEGAEAQWPGEAKISGRALAAGPITEGPDGDRFQADIAEVVHTHLNAEATMLVVEWWTPARGLRRTERE